MPDPSFWIQTLAAADSPRFRLLAVSTLHDALHQLPRLLGLTQFSFHQTACLAFVQQENAWARSDWERPTTDLAVELPQVLTAIPSGTTGLFEDMATHKCEETSAKCTGLMEWLFTHPEE